MHSSFLLAGVLPLAAAEACYSVIAKTHLVTTVATTVEYTTLPAGPSCTVSDVFPSEEPSHEDETTFEWVPTTGAFQWNPEPEPTGDVPAEPTGDHDEPEYTHSTDVSESTESPETPSEPTDSPDHPSKPTTTTAHPQEPEKPCTTTFVTTYETTSTIYSTSEETVSTEDGTTHVVTHTSAVTTTVCPVTETVTSVGPSETSAEESVTATSDADTATTTSADEDSEASTTSAEEGEATTTYAGDDDEATTTSHAGDATTTSESDEASTTSTDESDEATTTSTDESEATTTSSDDDEATTTSADESEATTTSAEEDATTTSAETSAEETSEASTTEASTTEASTTLSSVVTTSAATTSEASTTSEAPTTTTSEAPEETKYKRNYPADIVDELQDESMENLKEWLSQNGGNGCTLEKATVRREWGDLSREQREDYIGAVLCLQKAPSLYSGEVAGARSRFDDFVVTHQAQANWIHNTANFLSWHRYFLHEYEKTLKSECGYSGVMPYWNWDRYADDLLNSPMFNGDSASFGGAAGASGCVEDGPFADYKVSLGPGSSTRYNPRCLSREMSQQAAQFTKVEISYPLITQSNDVTTFQDRLQSGNNVHAAGHHTVGGNPGADVYTSPGDPYFHLHHAGVDRLWWIWQLQDLNSRLTAVGGRNGQTRRPGTLTELMNLGKNAGDVELQSLLNTMGGMNGELCYIYY